MEKNPDDWPEVIAPGAFDGIDQDVPLRLGIGGPVIGTARAKGTPEGLEVTTTVTPGEEDSRFPGGWSFRIPAPETD